MEEIHGLSVSDRSRTFKMAAPQEDGTALVVSENNTDNSTPRENGQVRCCLKHVKTLRIGKYDEWSL